MMLAARYSFCAISIYLCKFHHYKRSFSNLLPWNHFLCQWTVRKHHRRAARYIRHSHSLATTLQRVYCVSAYVFQIMLYERLTALMTKLKFDRPHVIILDKCCQKRHIQSPKQNQLTVSLVLRVSVRIIYRLKKIFCVPQMIGGMFFVIRSRTL